MVLNWTGVVAIIVDDPSQDVCPDKGGFGMYFQNSGLKLIGFKNQIHEWKCFAETVMV